VLWQMRPPLGRGVESPLPYDMDANTHGEEDDYYDEAEEEYYDEDYNDYDYEESGYYNEDYGEDQYVEDDDDYEYDDEEYHEEEEAIVAEEAVAIVVKEESHVEADQYTPEKYDKAELSEAVEPVVEVSAASTAVEEPAVGPLVSSAPVTQAFEDLSFNETIADVFAKVERDLKGIPEEYCREEGFNSLEAIGKVITSDDLLLSTQSELEQQAQTLDQDMDMIVSLFYSGFTKSFKNFSDILDLMEDSKIKVQLLNNRVEMIRSNLLVRTLDVQNLRTRNVQLSEMLRVVKKIEKALEIPALLKSFREGKHFYHMVLALEWTNSELNGEDLSHIAALSDLREQVETEFGVLKETLTEELYKLVYLQTDPSKLGARSVAKSWSYSSEKIHMSAPFTQISIVADDGSVLEDLAVSPDLNSRAFMRIILESSARMKGLSQMVSVMLRRLQPGLQDIIQSSASSCLDTYGSEYDVQDSKRIELVLNAIYDSLLKVLRNHTYIVDYIHSREDNSSWVVPDDYSGIAVWRAIQEELKGFLSEYLLERRVVIGTEGVEDHSKSRAQSEVSFTRASVLFSFADSFPKPGKKSSAKSLAKRVVVPSIYHITAIFKPLTIFCQQMEATLPSACRINEMDKDSDELKSFTHNLITQQFLSRVRGDLRTQVAGFLDSPSAFSLSTVAIGAAGSQKRLRSASELGTLISRLMTYRDAMPVYESEFVSILEFILMFFLDKCHDKWASVCSASESALLVGDSEVMSAMQTDPVWRAIQMGNINVYSSEWNQWYGRQASEARSTYAVLFSLENALLIRSPVHAGVLISTVEDAMLIGALSTSLDWLSKLVLTSFDVLAVNHDRDPLKKIVAKDEVTAVTTRKARSKTVRNQRRVDASALLSKDTSAVLTALSNRFQALSEQCLCTLRMELRSCARQMVEKLKNEEFFLQEPSTQPHLCVVALNEKLLRLQDSLSESLSPVKIRYLYNGLAHLISTLLVKLMPEIHSFNDLGIDKMLRNVLALQQCLTAIGTDDEGYFERTREYYMLLTMDSNAVLHLASERRYAFEFGDYEAVVKRLDVNPKKKEQILTTLHSLFNQFES
jgi:exocyst complex component 4